MAQLIMVAGYLGVGVAVGAGAAYLGVKAYDRKMFPENDPEKEDIELRSINVQTSEYGVPIPKVHGTFRVGGNVIWAEPIQEFTSSTGEVSLLSTFAVAFCAGPVLKVLRVWVDDKLVSDLRLPESLAYGGGDDRFIKGVGAWINTMGAMRTYLGTEDQMPDVSINEIEGVRAGKPVPAFRGMCYVVFESFPIAYTGGRIPNVTAEVSTNATESVPYTKLPIDVELIEGTPRQIIGFEYSVPIGVHPNSWADEIYMVSHDPTYPDHCHVIRRAQGEDARTGLLVWPCPKPHGGNYMFHCHAENHLNPEIETLKFAFFIVNVTKPGGRRVYDSGSINPSYLSFWWYEHLTFIYCELASARDVYQSYVWRLARDSESGRLIMMDDEGITRDISIHQFSGWQWRKIQVYYDMAHNPLESSDFEVYVDGTLEMWGTFPPGSGYSEGNGIAYFAFGSGAGLSRSSIEWFFDDIAVSSPRIPGLPLDPITGEHGFGVPRHYSITRLPPTGNGTYTDWNGDYTDIDEEPRSADAITWAQGASPPLGEETFTLSEPPQEVAGILAVKVAAVTLGNWNPNFGLLTISNGVRDESPLVHIRSSTGYDQVERIFTKDFGRDDAPWLRRTVQQLEVGVRGTGTNTTQLFTTQVLSAPGQHVNVGPDDNLVFYAADTVVLIMSKGSWDKYNCLTEEMMLHIDYAVEDMQEIPCTGCDFDSDEMGVIYTTRWTGDSEEYLAHTAKLDPETLAVTYEGGWEVDYPTIVRVSRNPDHPWLGIVAAKPSLWPRESGTGVWLQDKESMTYGVFDALMVHAPDGYHFDAMDIDDDTGWFWMLCNGVDSSVSGKSLIYLIQPNPSGETLRTEYDISAYVEGDGLAIHFDPTTAQVIVGTRDVDSASSERVEFWAVEVDSDDVVTLTYMGQAIPGDSEEGVIGPYPKSAWRRGAHLGYLYYAYEDHRLYRLDLTTRTVDREWLCDAAAGESVIPNWEQGCVYDVLGHSIITGCDLEDADYVRVWLDRAEPAEVALDTVVSEICEDAGLTAADIDVTDLSSDSLWGYLTDRARARASLQPLMDAFFFDEVESDGKLNYVKRGGASVVAIPESDLAAYRHGDERPQELVSTRQQELELPAEVEVTYVEFQQNYEQGIQRDRRQITGSKEKTLVDLPIALHPDAAKQAAVKWLAYGWAQRNQHRFLLPRGYSWLDPADVVTVTENSKQHRIRIDKLGYQGGILEVEGSTERVSTYESSATGVIQSLGQAAPDADYAGPTELRLIDCPLLKSAHNEPGIYLAAIGYTAGWRGARVHLSRDNGSSWLAWGAVTSAGLFGVAQDALADVADPFVWDEGGSVNVRVLNDDGTLPSQSELQVLNGKNKALLGDEIIQWRTATLETDGSYTLTGLLRGRHGTEWATGTHAIGDRFINLDENLIEFHGYEVDDKSVALKFRSMSVGMFTLADTPRSFTCELRNMKPWSVQHIGGERDDSNNLTLTWVRRARYGGGWVDEAGIPLAETTESYEVDVMSGTTVLRTITATTATCEYTAAQQTSDGLTPGDPVTVNAYQLSSVVRRGFVATATV